MPRYSGPSKNLDHMIKIAVDKDRLERLDANAAILGIPRAEAARRAFDVFHLTLSLSKSINATIQSSDTGGTP